MKKKVLKVLKESMLLMLIFTAFVGIFVVISNVYIVVKGKRALVSDDKLIAFEADCILIFGAGVWNGDPSPMLRDRLDEGIRLYNSGASPKIIVSGDHGQEYYDEVNVMKNYLLKAGIPDEDIFMDHAGFSTYESVYRAKAVFGVERMIVVTQEYHIYRALYIADKLGIETLGSTAASIDYSGSKARTVREWAARDKDILYCMLKVKPQYLGEMIDIKGSGAVTNDR